MGIFKGLKKKKIGFWAGDQNNFKFVDDLIVKLSEHYVVEKFLYEGDDARLENQMKSVNLGWFEWGNGPLIAGSNFQKSIPIISRIHRYEVYSDAPELVNWKNVDSLIFSSPSMIHRFQKKFSEQYSMTRSVFLPIGVDLDRFVFYDKPLTKQLIYVGRIHPHKNPALLLQIMGELLKQDPEYKLKVIGGFSDELYEEYFFDQINKLGIKDSVDYLGKLSQEKMVMHLQGADHFIITSIIEGLSQASLEAMACGVRPVISNYYGSEYAYDKSCIYTNISQAIDIILNPKITRQQARSTIEEFHDLEKQTTKVLELIKGLM